MIHFNRISLIPMETMTLDPCFDFIYLSPKKRGISSVELLSRVKEGAFWRPFTVGLPLKQVNKD